MNPRLVAMAALCREVAIPASVLAWLVAFGSGAAPIVDRLAPSLAANAGFAEKPPPVASAADVVTASQSVAEASAAAPQVSHEPEPIVTAALPDAPETLQPETSQPETSQSETPPEQAATPPDQPTVMSMAIPEPGDANRAIDSPPALDECSILNNCTDGYLWSLYQRTPKEDAVAAQEQKQVTVKKKGRLVTVTRTFTTHADEDFSWKDPKAAAAAGMPLQDYVIGGVDRDFKLRLSRMLHAAEQAGLSPGITSAFRDDYRQSIASGLKAANNRSYHGGSLRGGYGHGLAADVVSVNGVTRAQRLASSQTLWNWIDAHGREFGIGRPYLDRDPPHVAPIDGQEYASHRLGIKTRQAESAAKPDNRLALRDDRRAAKRARVARSSKVRAI